jgi:hypothetical protein
MALRKLLARGLPEPPAAAPGPADLLAEILNLPLLAPVRLFWEALDDMRPWWPILLPLLAWVGWRTYRRERASVLARRGTPLS